MALRAVPDLCPRIGDFRRVLDGPRIHHPIRSEAGCLLRQRQPSLVFDELPIRQVRVTDAGVVAVSPDGKEVNAVAARPCVSGSVPSLIVDVDEDSQLVVKNSDHVVEIRFCPDLRKFRTIAIRGDRPVLLIGVP
jgi:hypothetical protein